MIVYYITDGPYQIVNDEGDEAWEVKATVSHDGEAVKSIPLLFEDEDYALQFKKEVNYSMDPIEVGVEE